MGGGGENSRAEIKPHSHYRLYLTVEFEKRPRAFDSHSFQILVDSALRTIFGEAGRAWNYEAKELKELSELDSCLEGVVECEGRDLHKIWAGLSVYGSHFEEPVGIRVKKVTERLSGAAESD